MIQIRLEVEDIITGKQPRDNNLLKNAPHPISAIASSEWNRFGASFWPAGNTADWLAVRIPVTLLSTPCPGLWRKNFGQQFPAWTMVRWRGFISGVYWLEMLAYGDLNLVVSFSDLFRTWLISCYSATALLLKNLLLLISIWIKFVWIRLTGLHVARSCMILRLWLELQ